VFGPVVTEGLGNADWLG